MPENQEVLRNIRGLLDAEKFQEAFAALRPLLSYPGMVEQTDELVEVLATFADIAAAIAGDAFAEVVREAARKPEDPSALYHLGYELIEQNLGAISATILTRAHRLAPDVLPILSELCAALETIMRYGEAARLLCEAPESVHGHFLYIYLLAFNALMSGDLATPRRLLPDLERLQSQDTRYTVMVERIASMVQRADALEGHAPLDGRDLRGWHMVITAGILLHLSPHGFDEGMNGRYAFTQDEKERCLEGIRKVQAVLDALQVRIPRIFALPDRDSQILAAATALVFQVPLENWPENGSDEAGLIVAYDLSALDGTVLSTLLKHRPGQILWSHAACWTSAQPIAADLTTFLYQSSIAPWGAVMMFDRETNELKTRQPDERDPVVIGREIVSETLLPENLNDVSIVIDLARAAASKNALGLLTTIGQRQKQWAGSPVPSNYFG